MRLTTLLKRAIGLDKMEEKSGEDSAQQFVGGMYSGHYSTHVAGIYNRGKQNTMIPALYNYIAVSASSASLVHAIVDMNENYTGEPEDSNLNYIFKCRANIDQTGRDFLINLIMTILEYGSAVVVPTYIDDKTGNLNIFNTDGEPATKALELRVGIHQDSYKDKVSVELYNDADGERKVYTIPKANVAYIYNPLIYATESISDMYGQLTRAMNQLDTVNGISANATANILIKMPFDTRKDVKQSHAKERIAEIESQLRNNKYGIAYIGATEEVIQINRPTENNILQQVERLTKMIYSQLGISENIMNGSASQQELLNFHNTIIEPILLAITDEFTSKFLTRTAWTQGHRIIYTRDTFRLATLDQVVQAGDSLTRNTIATSNEIRSKLGWMPSTEPIADELRNKNLYKEDGDYGGAEPDASEYTEEEYYE